jgi:hypothetical protein
LARAVTADQLIAIAAGIATPILIAGAAGMWKLASMLAALDAVVNREMSHNGGASTKDLAKAGRDEAIAARDQAMRAKHLAENVDSKVDRLADTVAAVDRKVRQVSDLVVSIQAVQTFRDSVAAGPPGTTTSSQSTTTTTTSVEGTS